MQTATDKAIYHYTVVIKRQERMRYGNRMTNTKTAKKGKWKRGDPEVTKGRQMERMERKERTERGDRERNRWWQRRGR